MEMSITSVKLAIAGAAAGVWGLLGAPTYLVIALVVLISIDFATGVIAAGYERKLNSVVGFKGVARKIMILALIMVAHQLDILAGTGYLIRDASIIYFAITESISILENADRLGVPVPPVIVGAVESLKGKTHGR